MKAFAGIAEYRQTSTARRQSIAADQAEALDRSVGAGNYHFVTGPTG